jgi:LuxR family maltose regulon positive regulatory protein
LSALETQSILVLDDYHTIQAPSIHEQLNFWLEYQPGNLHLVILTREDPPVPIPRLRAQGQLLELRQNDLRFSLEECTRFLGEVMEIDLSAQDIAAMARRTEGWAAGLQLAAVAMQGIEDLGAFVRSFTGSHRFILDYLMDEVLNRQPAEVQGFLLKTSILDRLNGSLCDAVTGQPGSADRLRALEAANLFLFPLDQTRTWYRYHRLFAELLRHRLRQLDDSLEPALHRAASLWFAQNDDPAEAVKHALAAQDWRRATELIIQESDGLLRRGELATLSGWCQRLPESVVDADAQLCLVYAWPLLLSSQGERAEPLLTRAEQLAEDKQWLTGDIASAKAYLAQVQGDGVRLVAESERALALLPPENITARGVVAINLGVAYWHMGQLDAAQRALEEAQDAAKTTRNDYALAAAEVFLTRILAVAGHLRQAMEGYQALLSTGMGLPMVVLLHLDLATLYYEWNDLVLAEEHLEKGKQLALRSGNCEFQIAAHLLEARLRSAQGRRGQAIQAIEQAQRLVITGQVPARTGERIGALQIELAIQSADGLRGVTPPEEVDAHPFYRYLGLSSARLLLAEGEKAKAVIPLETALGAAEQAGWGYGALAVRSLLARAHGSSPSGLEHLKAALKRAQPEGYLRTFVDTGPQLAPLLKEAARQGIVPDYVGQILAAIGETHPTGAEAAAKPPGAPEELRAEALTGRELEVLHLVAAGLSNRQIAEQLVVSTSTVKSHVHHICGKLGARNRTQAVARARQAGWL